jgi:tetratricopeptide (TPR) repeat protein
MLGRNELDPALEALKESLALHETYQAHSWIAQVYLTQNRAQSALPHLERAVRLKPDDPSCLFNLSAAYLNAGDPEKTLERGLELERVDPSFEISRGSRRRSAAPRRRKIQSGTDG